MTEPMIHTSLSLPRRLVERARIKADSEGKPLRQVVAELLDRYLHPDSRTVGTHAHTLAYATRLLRRRLRPKTRRN